jgi:hypothetical protein
MGVWSEWWDATGRDELADLLLREWDVIGVTPFEDEARGEYNPEALSLGPMLRDGASVDEVAGYLASVAEGLHATSDRTRDRGVAEKVVAWYRHARATSGGSEDPSLSS